MPEERRLMRRARLAGVRATYEGASGEPAQADVVDISRDGVFLETTAPLGIGKRMALEIAVAGESAAWPALGRVVWTRPEAEGTVRPRGMGVKLIDVEDAVGEAIGRLVDTREQTEPGLGEVELPSREQTLLGVGAAVEPTPADETVAIDLVARKPIVRSAEPEPKRSIAIRPSRVAAIAAEEAIVIPKRRGTGWLGFLLILIAVAVAAYVFRDRLRQLEFVRNWITHG